jgi:16S rRNA processing protein RimM
MEPIADSISSTETQREFPVRVALGRVVGAHGLNGQLQVRYLGGGCENLLQASAVWLTEAEDDSDAESYEVVKVAPGRSGEVRMRLTGVEDRDAAERLRGQLLWVEEATLAELPPGEYYSYQLVGCRVKTEEGRELGTVREIWATGAADILVVVDEKGVQQLIPAVEEQLREIDLEGQSIVIEILPGLLDPA